MINFYYNIIKHTIDRLQKIQLKKFVVGKVKTLSKKQNIKKKR